MSRFLLAIRPSDAAIRHLRTALLERLGEHTTLVPQGRWHITVAFLGSVAHPPARLREQVEQLIVRRSMEPLRLRSSGSFGTACWIGLRPRHAVDQLHSQLRSLAADPKQVFTPHLTVLRAKQSQERRRFRQLLANYRGPRWTPHEVELISSTLGREVHHETVASIQLWSP